MAKAIDTQVVTLAEAMRTFATDGNVEALQGVYREVHTTQRSQVLTGAQMAVLVEVGIETMGNILDALNDLPSVTSTRTPAAPLTDGEKRIVAMLAARSLLDLAISVCTEEDLATETTPRIDEAVVRTADRYVKAVAGIAIGSAGKVANDVTIEDLLNAGTVTAGQKLTGRNGASAVLNADGSVTRSEKGATPQSLSAAAVSASGSKAENGWRFWRVGDADGAYIGTLR